MNDMNAMLKTLNYEHLTYEKGSYGKAMVPEVVKHVYKELP